MSNTDIVIVVFVAALLLIIVGVTIFYCIPPKMLLSERKQRKLKLEILQNMRDGIKMQLELYGETKELAAIVQKHPELEHDITEYITVRNEVFRCTYTLQNIDNGGKEDGKI